MKFKVFIIILLIINFAVIFSIEGNLSINKKKKGKPVEGKPVEVRTVEGKPGEVTTVQEQPVYTTVTTTTPVVTTVTTTTTSSFSGPDGNSGKGSNEYTKPPKEEEQLWDSLFIKKRGEDCLGDNILRIQLRKLGISDDISIVRNKPVKGKFYWIKHWGYDQAAYFFDFLDPVLLPLILKDFNSIWDTFKSYSPEDTTEYKDPYNLKRELPKNLNDEARDRITREMIDFNKRLDKTIYNLSLNANQINFGIKKNNWAFEKSDMDYAKSFIQSFDMNGDGRLSPREFLLGSIWHNKKILSSDDCTLCYDKLVDKLDGIFRYIDCNHDGIISSKDIHKHIQLLRRDTRKWNYFSLANHATIRTAVANDFVLKNMASVKGMLNKQEFRLGILLGFWDRQTDDYRVIDDDSKSMKSLRWKDNDIVDLVAANYINDKIEAEARAKADRAIALAVTVPEGDPNVSKNFKGKDVIVNLR